MALIDDQSRDRVLELAVQAGMLLEDVSASLILLPGQSPDYTLPIIENASSELERAIKLLRSAQAQSQ